MNITVIGASAGVGLEIVKQLVEAGDSVATLSRSTDSIPRAPNVTALQGDAMNEADVLKATTGADAVLVALGLGMSTKATGLYPQAAKALLKALASLPDKPPVIVLTGFGAGNSWEYNSWPMKLMFNLLLKDIYAEKAQMERMISEAYPNAMFVRPGRLTNGALTRQYKVTTELSKSTRIGSISRKDVADFMIAQARNPGYIGQYPALPA